MENNPATETNIPSIATEEKVEVLPSTEIDLEAKVKALEEEKARLTVERENYRVAYLKKESKKENFEDEEMDEKMRRIAAETLADSRLAEIAQEQDIIIKKALKENKELKLAQLNKSNTPPAAVGTHSESQPVRDTLVTPEQMAYFKTKGYTDKDIERYKKNLQRFR